MNSRIVGLAVVAVLGAAAGSAMGAGFIRIGTDPSTATGNSRYNGLSNGGAFVITNKGSQFVGRLGDNRTAGDQTTSNADTAANLNRRFVDNGAEKSFLSFCLERNEYIAPGGGYWTEIRTYASYGGAGGGSGGQDPLHPRTALLYTHFRQIGTNGNVPSTLFGGNIYDGVWDNADSEALQTAIWASENESQVSSLGTVALALYNWADNPSLHNNSIGNVRVLQLWTHPTERGQSFIAQDQLTMIPLPPAAWAGLSTLAGVGFVGYIRRRKQMV